MALDMGLHPARGWQRPWNVGLPGALGGVVLSTPVTAVREHI